MKNKNLIVFLCTLGFCVVVAVLMLVSSNTFSQTDTDVILTNLNNAFFVPGAISLCVGLLTFATNHGSLDMISYGMIKFFDLFRRDLSKVKYRSYNQYKEAQVGKEKPFNHFLIVGAIFIAISIVFLVIQKNI